MRPCSKCRTPHDRKGQRYCPDCHAAYQREHRAESGYAVANREKKAQRYVDFIWNVLTPENRVDAETITIVRRLTPKGWELLAGEAGERVPSEATRLRIIEILTQRVRDAKWGMDHGRDARGAA